MIALVYYYEVAEYAFMIPSQEYHVHKGKTHVLGRHPSQAKNMGLQPELSSRDYPTPTLLQLV